MLIANLIRRYNFDMFRFCADFALLVGVLFFAKNSITEGMAHVLLFSYLLFAIIHQTYYHSIKFIYNTEPLFINDWILIKRGISIAFQGYAFYTVLALFALGILFYGLHLICIAFLNEIYLSNERTIFYLLVLLSIFALGIYSIVRYRTFKSIYGVLCFILPSYKFYQNLKNSWAEQSTLEAFKTMDYAQLNESNVLQLNQKKNIFIIAVESYGRSFYDKMKFASTQKFIQPIEGQLKQKGWNIASQYSESPIMGGASWLSYSTLLKGMHIQSESTYSYLFKDEQHLAYWPLMQRLQKLEYDTWFISSIGGFEKMKIPWKKTLRFLGVEKVIKYKDLDYQGKHFGFGPSPPDQYSLNKSFQILKTQSKNKPFAAFWLSLNSHYPWDSPEEIADNWKGLNTTDNEYGINKELSNAEKYEKATQYQLKYLSEFIANQGTEDDLFLLIGDHQPFNIGQVDNRFCPVHIISKDEKLTNAFEVFGFEEGLFPPLKQKEENKLHHAGIQSMLIQVLNTCYGQINESTVYYPKGINENEL